MHVGRGCTVGAGERRGRGGEEGKRVLGPTQIGKPTGTMSQTDFVFTTLSLSLSLSLPPHPPIPHALPLSVTFHRLYLEAPELFW